VAASTNSIVISRAATGRILVNGGAVTVMGGGGLFDGSGLSLAEARETPAAGAEKLWMEKIAQPAPAAS